MPKELKSIIIIFFILWYTKGINVAIEFADNLFNTVSCYSEEDTNYCGKCPSCFRKWCALRANNLVVHFYNKPLMLEYKQKALDGHYIPERNELIIKILKEHLS